MALLGKQCVSARSKTRSVIATSTAEDRNLFAVFCSAAAAQTIGLKSLLQDMGETVSIKIGVDASAGKAIASRRGLGRSTHVQVQYLWIHSLVQNGSIVLAKPGEENRRDMMTKHPAAAKQNEVLSKLGYVYQDGQSRSAMKKGCKEIKRNSPTIQTTIWHHRARTTISTTQ